ncbi:MAG TPA: hypothetical protein VJ327_01055 [Patescibacteria group bacterium]|nr:hypothetical protein [Patescibacteria group bacterium]
MGESSNVYESEDEQIAPILLTRLGRNVTDEEVVEAKFNLSGFAKVLLKMAMERKYGRANN